MYFLIFTFLLTSLVVLGFTLKKQFIRYNVQRIYFQPPTTTDCSKQVPNHEDVITSKQTEKKHQDMANLLKQNHAASFRYSPHICQPSCVCMSACTPLGPWFRT